MKQININIIKNNTWADIVTTKLDKKVLNLFWNSFFMNQFMNYFDFSTHSILTTKFVMIHSTAFFICTIHM